MLDTLQVLRVLTYSDCRLVVNPKFHRLVLDPPVRRLTRRTALKGLCSTY
jgi:hypothetical protein